MADFQWDSEATEKAHVHCVILGFSFDDSSDKKIYDNEKIIEAKNINAHLIDTSDVFVEALSWCRQQSSRTLKF